ncbi:oligosaccharide flippase family protein [Cytobacillus firmus]|uniref:oligosaccharide flippase family protein n=1 Tax=Cytobacillus firmus TaxID=1399 RepID=UPI0020306C37|nr:oligosaccharide flippase family protein [Cytobacillus firmus]URT70593.1 oligosaccharide flippase family protein [Cytobacillus firmus]
MQLLIKINKFKKNRDISNILYSLLAYLIIPLGTIISTPILIKYLGLENYGYWILINSIIAIMGVSNFGLGNSIIKFGSKYIKVNQDDIFKDIISTTLFLSLVISLALILLSIVLDLFFYNLISTIIKLNIPFTIVTLIVSLKIVSGIFSSIIMAYQRYDITNKINIFFNLVLILFSTCMAVLTSKIEDLVIVLLITTAISSIFFFRKAKQILNRTSISIKFKKDAFKDIIHFGAFSWLQTIISIIYNQIDKIIVSILLGPQMLGVYTACLQIALKIHEIPTAAGAFLFPKFSESSEEGRNSYTKLYINASIILLLFIFLIGFSLFTFSSDILKIWIDEGFSKKYGHLLKVLIVSISCGTLFVVPFYLLNGLGYVKLNTLVNGLLSLVSVLSTLVLIPSFDLLGAAYGRLLGLPIIIYIIFYVVEYKLLKISIYPRIFLKVSFLEVIFLVPTLILYNFISSSSTFFTILMFILIVVFHALYSIPVFKFVKKRFFYDGKHDRK